MASFPGHPRSAGTKKVKPIRILMKQPIMEWQWHQMDHVQIICARIQADNLASMSSLIFIGWMLFLTPSQHRQSTEGNQYKLQLKTKYLLRLRLLLLLLRLHKTKCYYTHCPVNHCSFGWMLRPKNWPGPARSTRLKYGRRPG